MRKKKWCGKWIPHVKKEVVDSTACRCTWFHESMKSTEIIPLTTFVRKTNAWNDVKWDFKEDCFALFNPLRCYPASIYQDSSAIHFYVAPLHVHRNNHFISCVNVFTVIFALIDLYFSATGRSYSSFQFQEAKLWLFARVSWVWGRVAPLVSLSCLC